MHMEGTKEELFEYLKRQTSVFFPDGYELKGKDVKKAFELGLDRTEYCFKHISLSSYSDDYGQTFFSKYHADQYAQLLYFFSNSLWDISQNKVICDKIISLNRLLHGFFFSYKCKLPDIFMFGHPVGSIIGNAVYSDYLVIYQNVTINTSSDSDNLPAPVLGKGLFLGAGSKIIGNKPIGDRVSIGVNTVVYNKTIEDDKIVYTDSEGKLVVEDRQKEHCHAQDFFRPII